MQERRTRPATPADFHRLADLAHERGLRLFRDGPRWYCSSASDAGGCHYVTGFSCTCPGFVSHQRCSHHSLLLERLGWLPDLEESEVVSPETIDCPSCSGCGIQTYRSFEERCPACGGTGTKPSHHLHDVPPAPMVATAA